MTKWIVNTTEEGENITGMYSEDNLSWTLIGEFPHQPWTAGSTVRLIASTNPRGQPSRKQSDTSKSKRPGSNTKLVLLLGPRSVPSCIRLNTHTKDYIYSYSMPHSCCLWNSGSYLKQLSTQIFSVNCPSGHSRCRCMCFLIRIIWRNLHFHLLTNGSSEVNGCRQSLNTLKNITSNPHKPI